MIKALLVSVSASVFFSAPAYAQIVVNGGGKAKECYQKTKRGDPGRKSTIKLCETALATEVLTGTNEAATHINTAILHMRSGDYSKADMHYNEAITLRPKLSEAYISHAANHIFQGNYEAAVKSVTTGIELGTDKMPEALYNRAIAYDRLKQYTLAYKDLKQALALRPDWDDAVKAISRYDVVSRPG